MDILVLVLGMTVLAMILAFIIDNRSAHRGHRDVRNRLDVQSPIARILAMGPQCAQVVGVYKMHQEKENLQRKSNDL